MDWHIIKTGLLDELEKISEINLNGLSPDTIMRNSQPPPPMETPGYSKAKDILQRAEIIKTGEAEKSKDTLYDKALKTVGPTLAGAAVGKGIVELINPKMSDTAKRIAVLTGAGLGTANTAYKALRDRREKKLEQPMEKKQEMTKLSLSEGAKNTAFDALLGSNVPAALAHGYLGYQNAKMKNELDRLSGAEGKRDPTLHGLGQAGMSAAFSLAPGTWAAPFWAAGMTARHFGASNQDVHNAGVRGMHLGIGAPALAALARVPGHLKLKKKVDAEKNNQRSVKTASTPAMALKVNKQVGAKPVMTGATSGPTIKSQTSGLIGRKFQI